jgi:acyl carrier protein
MSSMPEILARLTAILAEILVLNAEDIHPSSKLVDDLDADSIAFLELTYRLRMDFGLEVPEAKVDEETLRLPLLEGIDRLEQRFGGTTLFEFMKLAALREDVQDPEARARMHEMLRVIAPGGPPSSRSLSSLWREGAGAGHARKRLAEIKIGELSDLMSTTVPRGFDPEAAITSLQLRDLFRFITVEAYVRYVLHLSVPQDQTRETGGADAMNAEGAASLGAKDPRT